MKKTYNIFAIVTFALFAMVSCQDDDFGKSFTPAEVGDEILFGGTSGYDDESRTVYGDKWDEYTEIKWYEGDMVRIYCAEARTMTNKDGAVQSCDYVVSGDSVIKAPVFNEDGSIQTPGGTPVDGKAHNRNSAYLTRATDEAVGLQWGADGSHTFYGVYPSPDQLTNSGDTDNAGKLSLVGNKLTAYLPDYQAPSTFVNAETITGTENKLYTVHPSMRYAYMVATQKVSAPTADGVALKFTPIVTAVEFTLVNTSVNRTYDDSGNEVEDKREYVSIDDIRAVNISSTESIAGDFTTTINDDGTFTNSNSSTLKTVTVPLATGTTSAVSLNHGDQLKFTVFLLPNADLTDLTITLEIGVGEKSTTLNNDADSPMGTDFKIVAKKKNFITDLSLDLSDAHLITSSNWMNYLSETEKAEPLSGLSIPGAGGAWSGCKDASGNNYLVEDRYREQNLTFDELWNQGVRCFEMQVDDDFNLHCNTKALYENGTSTRLSFDTALQQVLDKVQENSTECAFVIVTYSNTDGVADRNSGSFQSTLSSKVNSLNSGNMIIPWTASTTYNTAKGKVMIISRPGSIGVDYGWHGLGTGNGNILSILGWGSMPDQWYARGFGKLQNYYSDCYTTSDDTFLGIGTRRNYTLIANSMDIYDKNVVNNLTAMRPFTINGWNGESQPNYSNGSWTYGETTVTSDFGYYAVSASTERYGGSRSSLTNSTWDGHNAWVQEWKRVVETDFSCTSGSYTYAWKSSVDEKWDDITETLSKSMSDVSRKNYSYYINSLCGYFVTVNETLSYIPALNVQRYGVASATGAIIAGQPNDNNIENKIYCDDKYQEYVTTSVTESAYTSMNFSVSNWGPYNENSGLAGDVESYAKWVNDKFYSHLLSLQAGNKLPGPTGIVLMDRISNDKATNPAGYYCPQIIISNNDLEWKADL